jgi:hypothetical protein
MSSLRLVLREIIGLRLSECVTNGGACSDGNERLETPAGPARNMPPPRVFCPPPRTLFLSCNYSRYRAISVTARREGTTTTFHPAIPIHLLHH